MRATREHLLRSVREHRLWEPGMTVAVAVSGGGDSMALLELLVATAYGHGARLSVVTVDHGIHADSASWADLVLDRARSHGLPGSVLRLGLGPQASEADARSARYAALDGLNVDRVALAHHRRDQAETVVVHLLRGTGPRGLAGMPRVRGRYVRPALDLDPDELARYRPATCVDDPANTDPDFLRVRVRTELLPLIEHLREGSVAALARSAGLAREDDDLLSALADVLPLARQALLAAPRPLARRRLHSALGPVGTGLVEAGLALIARGGGQLDLDADRVLVVDGDEVRVQGRDRGDRAR
jgi:tRNA(Ile)-lysidine synthase